MKYFIYFLLFSNLCYSCDTCLDTIREEINICRDELEKIDNQIKLCDGFRDLEDCPYYSSTRRHGDYLIGRLISFQNSEQLILKNCCKSN